MDKQMKSYELFLIFSTHISEDERFSLLNKFREIINANGIVESEDNWGKKRLACQINKENNGFYIVISFKADSSVPNELDRISNITDGLLRSLVLSSQE